MSASARALVPEDLPRNGPRAAVFIARACFAAARRATNQYNGPPADEVAEALYRDQVTPLVLRAAASPASTTATSWAGRLARDAVGDFISSLAPISAAAKLFDACVRVNLDGINSISFPARSAAIDSAGVVWVGQGAPIPVGQYQLTGVTLGPTCKLAILTALTREVAEHGSGEVVLTTLLKENAALALDASLFSNAAATADRPAGLLAGITALAAVAGGGDAAMLTDLTALAGAIADDTTGFAIVAHPAQANAIKLRRGPAFPADVPVWATLGVAEGTVIVVDPRAIAAGFGAEPEITASKEAVLHMESAPLQIATGAQGSGILATPSRSLFQTDCIAVRLILKAAWALRAPGGVAWMQSVSW